MTSLAGYNTKPVKRERRIWTRRTKTVQKTWAKNMAHRKYAFCPERDRKMLALLMLISLIWKWQQKPLWAYTRRFTTVNHCFRCSHVVSFWFSKQMKHLHFSFSIQFNCCLALLSEIPVALYGNIDLRVNYWQNQTTGESKKGNNKKKHLGSIKPE